jgi:hypothetical protein
LKTATLLNSPEVDYSTMMREAAKGPSRPRKKAIRVSKRRPLTMFYSSAPKRK